MIMAENTLEIYKGISEERLTKILNNIRNVKIGFIGDLCVDIYWIADMRKSELSRETPNFPLPVVEERYQLGAGGNVIANIAALKPKAIRAVSVIGDDWRGMLVRQCLGKLNVSMENILVAPGKTTNAYCKPIRFGISKVEYEDPRIDFTSELPNGDMERDIIERLDRMASEVEVICVSDQFPIGCITPSVREEINRIAKQGKLMVVDSRDRIGQYRNVTLKPNEVESVKAAAKLSGLDEHEFYTSDLEGFAAAGKLLQEKLGCDLSMTLGSRGNIQFHGGKAVHILPRDVTGPLDFCGAGDTFLSAYTSALAAGASREEAGQIGALASEVTICKINQTGTADSGEIIDRFIKAYGL
jgi:rfaE bifunctional protein kinase chain/domain